MNTSYGKLEDIFDAKKQLSKKELLSLIKDYNTASLSVCHSQLAQILNEIDGLTSEFKSISLERQGNVKELETGTVSVVKSDISIEDKIKLVKSKFKETINMFQDDLVKLDQMTYTDHLTGLSNRRFLDNQLKIEISQALQEKTWLNLLMIDIDDFKLFNDTYGHLIGDQALKIVASNIQIVCQDESSRTGIEFFPARYGGEEFSVILPAIDKNQALNIASKILTKISDYSFVIRNKKGRIKHENLKLTVSIGLAIFSHQYDTEKSMDDLIQNADAAMFKAKKAGKNCIKTSTESD